MVDISRDDRNEVLQQWIDEGARCPFCNSANLNVGPIFEMPKPESRSAAPQLRPTKPYEFVRANCAACGYILLFDSAKFRAPRR
jgi:hypothetical protein